MKILVEDYAGTDYTPEEIREIKREARHILDNYRLEATDVIFNKDKLSVCVTDINSDIDFWFDIWLDNNYSSDNLRYDYSKISYHNTDVEINPYLREELFEDDDLFFNAKDVAIDYAFKKGLLHFDEDTEQYRMSKDPFNVMDWDTDELTED